MNPTILTETIYKLRVQIKGEIDNGVLNAQVGRDRVKDLSEILANLQRAERDYILGKK